MKKLLGVIGILALAAALLPSPGYADLRGSFAPLSIGAFVNGTEQPANRPIDADGIMSLGIDGGRIVELWFSGSTRSLIPGRESVRSIFLEINFQQGVLIFGPSGLAMLLHDPAANVSYFDPAWSHDGRFLAYVQTNADGTNQALYVQEYVVNDGLDADYGPGLGAETAIGSPILVSTASNVRHPNWHSSQHSLVYDSNAAGSPDLYSIDVDVVNGTVGAPTRLTFSDTKAETDGSWSPNGHEIAYATNKFGPNIIEIIDLNLSSGDPGYARLAEINFAAVSHNNPDWTSDGGTIFYDAPTGEDPAGVTDVWSIKLSSQAKCEIIIDLRADGDPDVSGVTNNSDTGPFNYFIFTSQAGGLGVLTWRANQINTCPLPLAMGVATVPAIIDLEDETATSFMTVMNFPPETRDTGYRCASGNSGVIEGVRLRNSFLLGAGLSPTLMGLASPAGSGVVGTSCFDSLHRGGAPDTLRIRCNWNQRTIAAQIEALGLVGKIVPLKMTAYSNNIGRAFQGFAYIKLTKNSLPAPAVSLLGNSPNPFNPVTKIAFAVSKPGNYSLRLYNVQGALIKTLASRHFEAGTHEATWDGRTTGGGMAASGVYYAKISSANKKDVSEGIKLVLAK